MIWQFREQALVKDASIPLNDPVLAVVRYSVGDAIASQLAGDTHVRFQHDDPLWGFVLVGLENQEQLDRYAGPAHLGGACGRLERLSLGQRLVKPNELLPPIYSTGVTLSEVAPLVSAVKADNINATVTTLAGLGNRYHAGKTPALAPDTVTTLFKTAGAGLSKLTVAQKTHQSTVQNSVIATLPGVVDDAVTVIVGAHLDSISSTLTDAPGADDDASGIGTLVEVLRVIAANQLTFKRRIEFHGYAAEEVGLVGSKELAASYAAEGRSVAAMLQVDMDSYSAAADDKTIYLIDHDTTVELRRALKQLIHAYTDVAYKEGTLPAGALSDHKAWYDQGFNAVFPFENPKAYNAAIHTPRDTTSNANNPALAARFAQLTLAFLVHYAGLTSAGTGYSTARSELLPASIGGRITLALTAVGSGFYSVGIAAPAATTTVEFCRIGAGSDDDCKNERQTATVDSTKSGTFAFFGAVKSQALVKGQRWRFHAYDSSDRLLAYRQIEL